MSDTLNIHGDTMQLGTFLLGTEEFAVDLLKLREIIRVMPITKVPCAESFVEGAINLRGSVIPIINLRRLFKMQPKEFTPETRIMNISVHNLVLGFVVDKIGQVRRIPAGEVKPAPAVIASVDSDYITGVYNAEDHLLIILDVEKLIDPDMAVKLAQS